MACVRTILVLGVGLALGGCEASMARLSQLTRMFEINRPSTVKPLEDGSFQVELEPSRIKSLGGPRSPGLESHVAEEVANSGLCKGGIRIVSEWWGNGYYGIKGQCR